MRYYETPRDEINWFREEYEFLSNFYPSKVFLTVLHTIIQRLLIRHKSV